MQHFGGFTPQSYWEYSEYVTKTPAPLPHLRFATVWRLVTWPAYKQYAQKNPSYGPDTTFKFAGFQAIF